MTHADEQREWAARNPEYVKAYRTRRYRDQQRRINEIKLASGCVDCGYREHAVALDFDHKPGTEKSFNIGSMVTAAWSRLEAEIAKCEVRCANCHRVKTAERRSSK